MNERKYIAISIKHSTYDKNNLILWGSKGKTEDNEKRCFSGYTTDINKCEIYSLEDFQRSYGNSYIKCDEPVKMCSNIRKKYKDYDTVLVDFSEYKSYLKLT